MINVDINRLAMPVDRFAKGIHTTNDDVFAEDVLVMILIDIFRNQPMPASDAEIRLLLTDLRRKHGWPSSQLRWGVCQALTHPTFLAAKRELAIRKMERR